jgi:hypothetical protein
MRKAKGDPSPLESFLSLALAPLTSSPELCDLKALATASSCPAANSPITRSNLSQLPQSLTSPPAPSTLSDLVLTAHRELAEHRNTLLPLRQSLPSLILSGSCEPGLCASKCGEYVILSIVSYELDGLHPPPGHCGLSLYLSLSLSIYLSLSLKNNTPVKLIVIRKFLPKIETLISTKYLTKQGT